LTGLPFWQIALPAAIVIVALLWALERARPWRGELGKNADGFRGGKPASEAPGAAETIRARAS
jgi:hypothetical protein